MKEWDRANMKTLSVNLKKNEAEAFQKYAEEHGTRVAALLRGFIQATLSQRESSHGVPHAISYKNADRLKHEVSFHNPDNLTPDEMLNAILDRYFRLVKEIRK